MKVVCRLRDLRLLDYQHQQQTLSCMTACSIHIREAPRGAAGCSKGVAAMSPWVTCGLSNAICAYEFCGTAAPSRAAEIIRADRATQPTNHPWRHRRDLFTTAASRPTTPAASSSGGGGISSSRATTTLFHDPRQQQQQHTAAATALQDSHQQASSTSTSTSSNTQPQRQPFRTHISKQQRQQHTATAGPLQDPQPQPQPQQPTQLNPIPPMEHHLTYTQHLRSPATPNTPRSTQGGRDPPLSDWSRTA